MVVPDLWQQEAVRALRDGKDVVVQAPTGSGKTFIFELLYPSLKGQAIFTVPTRALANDKLAEWRARGWDVGIATGDLALNLNAKVLVATLETQRARFLRRDGPRLLVVDEYQMIADPVRGVHYELALALAPRETQLLLLSGSVQNPQDVVAWFQRIGRDPVLISHNERPVPLEEIDLRASAGVAIRPDEEFLAAHDRESVAGGSRAGAGLRAAPQRQRRDGASDRFRAFAARSAPAFRGTGSARRQTALETFAQPRGLSSQRTQLRRAGRPDRAARESRPAQCCRRDDGARGRHQLLHALGSDHRYPLQGGKLRAPRPAGRASANVWPGRPARAG